MQDPNPLPWGTQDRFQAHFIVRKEVQNAFDYIAKTGLSTTGYFGSKKVVKVKWDGGKLAKILNEDASLKELIQKQSVNDATIFVDPSDNGIRIYGKWKNNYEFRVTKDLFAIYDKIAGHIKTI